MNKRRFIMGFIFMVMVMVLGILLIMGGPKKAKAEIRITDCFSVTGFLRYEMAVHTGGRNPNNFLQDDNHDLNFARSYLQTESGSWRRGSRHTHLIRRSSGTSAGSAEPRSKAHLLWRDRRTTARSAGIGASSIL